MSEEATLALKKLVADFEASAATAKAAIEAAAKEKQEIARLKAELATLRREHQEELAAAQAAFAKERDAYQAKVKDFHDGLREAIK